MEIVRDKGLDQQVHILAGIIPIRSVGMARYMRDYVSGVSVPDEIITRMERAKDAREEGIRIPLEIIEQLKGIPGGTWYPHHGGGLGVSCPRDCGEGRIASIETVTGGVLAAS